MNKTIQFKGINLNNSITNNADGNCEEVLNLRPKPGRWEAVQRKREYSTNFRGNSSWVNSLEGNNKTIVKYFQHKVGDVINDIFIVQNVGDGIQTDYGIKGVWLKVNDDYTNTPIVLWQINTVGMSRYPSVETSLGIDIESVGNFLTFNLPEVTTFLWQDGAYQKSKQTEVSAPKIEYAVQSRFSPNGALFNIDRLAGYGAQIGGYSASDNSLYHEQNSCGCVFNSYKSAPVSAFNLQDTEGATGKTMPLAFCNIQFTADVNKEMQESFGGNYKILQEDTEDYREGFVFICSAYQLFDGSYTNISAPIMLHLGTTGMLDMGDEDSYDTFYCRDKIQIQEYHLNGYPSLSQKFGFRIGAYVRRQRQQRVIIQRPEMPEGLGKEYSKVVYFVSKPISMYDFSKIDVHKLHIHRMMAVEYDDDFSRCIYESVPWDSHGAPVIPVRFSLANTMETLVVNGTPFGIKFTNDELKEALPFHMPTKEELETITFYKAVEFNYRDESDKGEMCSDETSSILGKIVNFSNLIEDEILTADTSSNETYKAKGLMTYNQRLHLYGVTTKLRDDISTIGDNDCKVNFRNIVYTGYKELTYTGKAHSHLYYAEYEDNTNKSTKSVFKYIEYAKYNIEINGEEYSYIGSLNNVQSPVIPFMDARLKSIDIYWQSGGKYYTSNVHSFESKVYNMCMVDLWKFKRTGMEEINADIVKTEITDFEYALIQQNADKWVTASEYPQLNRLKVSNQNNPIIFPVELDYNFDDEIVALGNNYKEISLAQEGQYPTYVFTKKGIWSMGLGSSAFYATQVPIHPDVAVCRNTLGIGSGVIYIAKDGIKLLSGREVVSISEQLRGNDSPLGTLTSVKSALGYGQTNNRLNTLMTHYGTSVVDNYLQENLFNKEVVIGFDRVNNEVLFSETGFLNSAWFTYVFSLNEKMWYKRSESFYSFYRDYGCRTLTTCPAINLNGNAGVSYLHYPNTVVSLCDEDNGGVPREQGSPVNIDTQALILTRPMSIGNLGFKEVYHSAIRGELKQNWQSLGTIGKSEVDANNPHLGFYILASNDGGTWKMVGGKVWKESVTQVVLERIKQSYRYVAFMLAGYVHYKFNVTHIDLDGIDKLNTRQR